MARCAEVGLGALGKMIAGRVVQSAIPALRRPPVSRFSDTSSQGLTKSVRFGSPLDPCLKPNTFCGWKTDQNRFCLRRTTPMKQPAFNPETGASGVFLRWMVLGMLIVAAGNLAWVNAGQRTDAKSSSKRSVGTPDRGHWVDPVKAEPAGTHYRTFFSATIQGQVSYLIYFPAEYEVSTARRYPVVYWLHGGGGNQRTGDNFIERLEASIRSGSAPPMLAILVNGVGGSLFCNSIDGNKPVETVIVEDLIPHIDATYRTLDTPQMRAIEGFSMGGFGALHLAFKYPQLFAAVTALAHAPIRPDSGWQRVDRVWQTGPFAGNAEYFQGNDPFHLVEKNAGAIRQCLRVRLIVGDADNPNTVARTKELCEKMAALKVLCELILVPGVKHSYMNLYEKLGEREFAFYREVFAVASPSAGSPAGGAAANQSGRR